MNRCCLSSKKILDVGFIGGYEEAAVHYNIVDDLKEIIDCIVEKSYQLSKNEIIIKLKNQQTKIKEILFIRNGEILTITNKQFATPKRPSNFIMALRKYIQNGRILNVSQHDFDRIIKIEIGKKAGIYTLIIEFFSEGNIILPT